MQQRKERREHPLALPARTLVVFLACAAVLAALAASRPNSSQPSTSTIGSAPHSPLSAAPLTISTLTAAQIACPSGASFTPDGAAFALLGTATDCDTSAADAPDTYKLVIVDAAYGKVTASVALDPLVLGAGTDADVRSIRYAGLGWSPNGLTYAVAFVEFDQPNSVSLSHALGSGLLLVSRYNAAPRVIPGDAGFFAAATSSYAGLPIWNIAGGTVTAPVAALPSLSYTWKSGNTLDALSPLGPHALATLPTGAGPRYPVGNPSEDATFTIWQPGVILGPLVAPAATRDPADGAFVTSFATWSPDGSHVTVLVAGVALSWSNGGDAESSLPAQNYPAIPAPGDLIQTPPRDAALSAVQREVGQSGWALVAWNPDGSLLASIQCNRPGTPSLELRATTTGAVVGHALLHLSASDPGCGASSFAHALGAYANPNLRLIWSTDGSRILVSDQAANTVAEWGVTQI